MALSPSFKLRQSQSLVMTPQLMQSIKLLQMTAGELEQFIEKALEKNPLLERSDADDCEGETDPYAESGQETGKFDLSLTAPTKPFLCITGRLIEVREETIHPTL